MEVLGWPLAGVDGLCCLCCGVAVGGLFTGGRTSVFQAILSLLVRWVNAWGSMEVGSLCGRPPDGASCSSRAGLQQCKSFVEMCTVSCLSASQHEYTSMWAGGCNLGLPSLSFAPCHDSPDPLYLTNCGWLSFGWL